MQCFMDTMENFIGSFHLKNLSIPQEFRTVILVAFSICFVPEDRAGAYLLVVGITPSLWFTMVDASCQCNMVRSIQGSRRIIFVRDLGDQIRSRMLNKDVVNL